MYTNSSITQMEQALADFHSRKQCIIDIGARRGTKGTINHFNIPKIELMMSFACQTRANSALIQYTVDVSEHLLITHCKMTFRRTSRQSRTYVDQVMDILNHEETIWLFDLYLILWMVNHSAIETIICTEHEETTIIDPTLDFLQCVLPEQVSKFHSPRPFRNLFKSSNVLISTNGEIALHVTIHPDHATLSVAQMQALYYLPDLLFIILCYVHEASQDYPMCEWDIQGNVSTWNKFRIQLHSSFHRQYVDKSQVVQAFPPSDEYVENPGISYSDFLS